MRRLTQPNFRSRTLHMNLIAPLADAYAAAVAWLERVTRPLPEIVAAAVPVRVATSPLRLWHAAEATSVIVPEGSGQACAPSADQAQAGTDKSVRAARSRKERSLWLRIVIPALVLLAMWALLFFLYTSLANAQSGPDPRPDHQPDTKPQPASQPAPPKKAAKPQPAAKQQAAAPQQPATDAQPAMQPVSARQPDGQQSSPQQPAVQPAVERQPVPASSSADDSSSADALIATGAKPSGQSEGFLASVKWDGSSSSSGQIMTLTPTIGYNFNRIVGWDAALPMYFVNNTSSTTLGLAPNQATSGTALGDISMDLRFNFDNRVANYASTITGAAPTGNTELGASTGQWTYDWTNHFERAMWRFTPFADAGLGDSVTTQSITFRRAPRFHRPFTSIGHEAHFEAGTQIDLFRGLSLSGSLYDIAPWGQQIVISRLIRRTGAGIGTGRRAFEIQSITVGGASLARDNGYNLGLSLPVKWLTFEVGFSHSVHNQLDTITWGINLNVWDMVKPRAPQSSK